LILTATKLYATFWLLEYISPIAGKQYVFGAFWSVPCLCWSGSALCRGTPARGII